ncbi:MAG TPA: energy transducer TonB [Marinobacter sp.]|nr:energy transducer TonB [Marinobacter sp.]
MPGKPLHGPASPASYRLALALSLAFMAHTLLLASLPSPLPPRDDLSHRIAFQLVSPSSAPASASTPAASAAPAPRHPEFEVPLLPDRVTTTAPAQPRASPQPEPPAPEPVPATPAPGTPEPPAAERAPGVPSAPQPGTTLAPEPTTQISQLAAEDDPYLVALAVHLAEKLEQQRLPAISRLTQPVTMTLELTLLPNGALTRARVLQSTGVQRIDEAAYRAALAASPYPEPVGEESDRFEIKLVFNPKRS